MLRKLLEWFRRRGSTSTDGDSAEANAGKTIHELLAIHRGDLIAALRAGGFYVIVDEAGDVSVRSGTAGRNLSESELGLLTEIHRLKRLNLRQYEFPENVLSIFGSLRRLDALHLQASLEPIQLSDQAMLALRDFPALREIGLENATVSEAGFRHLAQAESIDNFSISHSPVTTAGIEAIAALPRLKRLLLWGPVELSDCVFPALRRCETLEELDLSLCEAPGMTNAAMTSLEGHPRLQKLELGDANITGECVDSLMTIPCLKIVSVGNEKLSLESKLRLEKRGIALRHGRLKGFRRQGEFLRYLGIDFAIDRQQSGITAWVGPKSATVHWDLSVRCTDEHLPEHTEPAHLEGPPFTTTGSWREIEGQEFELVFENHEPFPTNPGNIYVGWHEFPNDHHIRFVTRTGTAFLIDWKCQVRAVRPNSRVEPIWLSGTLDLRHVCVWNEGPLSQSEAYRLASRHFDSDELGTPREERIFNLTRFWFPVLAND